MTPTRKTLGQYPGERGKEKGTRDNAVHKPYRKPDRTSHQPGSRPVILPPPKTQHMDLNNIRSTLCNLMKTLEALCGVSSERKEWTPPLFFFVLSSFWTLHQKRTYLTISPLSTQTYFTRHRTPLSCNSHFRNFDCYLKVVCVKQK